MELKPLGARLDADALTRAKSRHQSAQEAVRLATATVQSAKQEVSRIIAGMQTLELEIAKEQAGKTASIAPSSSLDQRQEGMSADITDKSSSPQVGRTTITQERCPFAPVNLDAR